MAGVKGRSYWMSLRIYGVDGKLYERIRSFYRTASASVCVNGEFGEFLCDRLVSCLNCFSVFLQM